MPLKCLIFDVDGTMADTERDGHRVAFNLAFKEEELNWYWDEQLYGSLLKVTGGKERIKYYQSDFLKKNRLSDNKIKALHALKTQYYIALLKSGKIPLRKGVKRLIKQAQAENITLAISTTTTPINVTTLLKASLGSQGNSLFKVIATGDIVANKKPAPDIYRYTLEKLKIDKAQCLAIEDSEAGLESATQAGIKTIITTNVYTQNQDFSKAEKVYSNFSNINTQSLQEILGDNHV